MKEKKLHREAPDKVRAVPPRSVKSIVNKYLIIGSTVLTLGCGAAAAPQLASLVNVPTADTKSKTIVTPDKEGPAKVAEKKKTEISITELKNYQLKFKEKQGAYYEMVSETDERFYVEVAMKKPITIENGKKILTASVVISHLEKKKGEDQSYIFVKLIDANQNKIITGWGPNFDKLAKEYKEITGKELKYVHVVVEQGNDDGEYVNFYVIPATSKKAVEKGIIESGMPVHAVGIYQNTKENKYEGGSNYEFITASADNKDDIVAQK